MFNNPCFEPSDTATVSNQTWQPDDYQKNAGFVAALGQDALDLLAPVPGERILDLGCGDGVLTTCLANEYGCDVVGVDASPEQIHGAKNKYQLEAYVMNAMALTFEASFDAVFSNAALHWMKDADAVLAGVAKALKTKAKNGSARFVAEFGGAGNVEKIRAALYKALSRKNINAAEFDPWYFPTVAEYSQKLEQHGFEIEHIELIDRPTALPGDIEGWLFTFAESFLNAIEKSQWLGVIQEIRETLRPDLLNADGIWMADYKRLQFAATFKG